MKKKITKLFLVFFLMVIYAYTLAIENLPDNLVIFEGENILLKTLLGMQIDTKTLETASNTNQNTINPKIGKANVKVSFFNQIPLKDVKVDILPKTKVIPCRKYCRSKIIYEWSISSRHVRNRRGG